MTMLHRLFRDVGGATVVEFALVAPVFLSMVFLTLEGGRMLWLKQGLQDVAFSTARCIAVDPVNCDTDAKRKSYAVSRAATTRIIISASDVVIQANQTCDGNAGQNKVSVTKAFNSPVNGFFPAAPTTLTSHACFPTLVAS